MKKYILFAFLSVPGVARAESPPYKFAAETLFDGHRRDIKFPSVFSVGKWACDALEPHNGPMGWQGVISCSVDGHRRDITGVAVFARCSEQDPMDSSVIILSSGPIIGSLKVWCE
jgi:hypothetical protein